MNTKPSTFLTLALAALLTPLAQAGSLTYVGIPASGSDAGSGINTQNVYTSAVDGGNATGADRTVNGVPLHALSGTANTSTGDNITLSVASGSLNNGGGKSQSIAADGVLAQVLSDMTLNAGADDNSEQYLVLDPASLAAGKTYDLRVYICNSSSQNRQVNLTFAGDGQDSVSTDFFNEDDATTSPGGFTDANQVYYVNYRYTWDGSTTPGFTATQKSGGNPFALYAVTNQEVTGDTSPAPSAAPETPPPGAGDTADTSSAQAGDDQVGVSSDAFYSSPALNDSGRWVDVGSYGRCWQPNGVAAGWRPYTVGRWHHCNQGWVWDSPEPWGYCTYHYGRWALVDGAGWCWVPGKVWAPAWVSWRYGHGYCGWAPLPPAAVFNVNVGISTWVDNTYNIGPGYYNFCTVQNFGAANLAGVLLDSAQNIAIFGNTLNVTNIVNDHRHIYVGGPNFRAINGIIQRGGGHPIDEIKLDTRTRLGSGGKFSSFDGKVLSLVAPAVIVAAHPKFLPKIAASFRKPKLDHGWSIVKDPKVKDELKQKISLEVKGHTRENTHALRPGTKIVKGKTTEDHVIKKPGVAIKGHEDVTHRNMIKPGETIKKTGEVIKKAVVPTKSDENKKSTHPKEEVKKATTHKDEDIKKPGTGKVEENKKSSTKSDEDRKSTHPKEEVKKATTHKDEETKKPGTRKVEESKKSTSSKGKDEDKKKGN